GIPEQELSIVYTSMDSARGFVRRPGVVSQWEMTVKDFDSAPDIASRVRAVSPAFAVKDWIHLNSTLFFSLKLERIAMFVILLFIVIVGSFNIVTTLVLMVLEKKPEVAILRTMGARRGEVAAIFLAEGLFIGTLGVGLGLISGF